MLVISPDFDSYRVQSTQRGSRGTTASAYYQHTRSGDSRRLDWLCRSEDCPSRFLAIGTPFSLAHSTGQHFSSQSSVGGQRRLLRVHGFFVRSFSTKFSRKGTYSSCGMGAGCPSEPHSRIRFNVNCCCGSIFQGCRNNGFILRCCSHTDGARTESR